jgi:hypothetical protein
VDEQSLDGDGRKRSPRRVDRDANDRARIDPVPAVEL